MLKNDIYEHPHNVLLQLVLNLVVDLFNLISDEEIFGFSNAEWLELQFAGLHKNKQFDRLIYDKFQVL